jgi:hypothetical protein
VTQFTATVPGAYKVRAQLGRLSGQIAIRVVAPGKMGSIPTLTLVLAKPSPKDKELMALVGRVEVPQGMPPDSAVRRINVPLYEGATPESIKVDNYPAPIPASYYLLASPVLSYRVNAPQTRVDLWYLNAFRQMGYSMNGQGGGPTNVNTYDFTKDARASESATIGIRTQSVSGGTEVVYGATDVVVAPRPASSLLPLSARSLTLTYRGDATAKALDRVVTRSAEVREVIRALNAMPLRSGSVYFGCPPQSRPSVRIHVVTRSGHARTIDLFENFCRASTIGSVQVVPPPSFWTLIRHLLRG